MEVIDYKGEERVEFFMSSCPLCSTPHKYEFTMHPVALRYNAILPAAYAPHDRQIKLTCPTTGNAFRILFRIHYPYHRSSIVRVSVDGEPMSTSQEAG